MKMEERGPWLGKLEHLEGLFIFSLSQALVPRHALYGFRESASKEMIKRG
eukprot:SAG31_NODE_2312_length_5957_cov_14.490611_2_plen_50_part_00